MYVYRRHAALVLTLIALAAVVLFALGRPVHRLGRRERAAADFGSRRRVLSLL